MTVVTLKHGIVNILKNISTSVELAKSAKYQLDMMLFLFIELVVDTSVELVFNNEVKTLTSQHIASAVRIIFRGDLCKNMLLPTEGNPIFDVKMVTSIINHMAPKKVIVAKECPPFVGHVIEYLCKEILDLAVAQSYVTQSQIIDSQHIYDGIMLDSELRHVFETYSFIITGCGKNQTDERLILPLHPFSQMVREITDLIIKDMELSEVKISKSSFLTIQYYVEDQIIRVLEKAKRLCEFSGRSKVAGGDIEMAIGLSKEF